MKHRTEIEKEKIPGSRLIYILVNLILAIVLMLGAFAFGHSYRQLRLSVQDERADSVKQLASLITGKVSELRSIYVAEAKQLALTISHSGAGSLADISYLCDDGKNDGIGRRRR